MIRKHIIYLFLLCFCVTGCATPLYTKKGGPTSNLGYVCFTRDEIARIQAFKVRCRSTIKQERLRCKLDKKSLVLGYKTMLNESKIKLKSCFDQCKAVSGRCRMKVGDIVLSVSIGFVAGVLTTFIVIGFAGLSK